MALDRPLSFGELLRRYRQRASLTQEELAERARLSAHAISQLERGARRAPRRDTVGLLAEALSLTETERAAFEAVARQHRVMNAPESAPPAPSAERIDAPGEMPPTPVPDSDPPPPEELPEPPQPLPPSTQANHPIQSTLPSLSVPQVFARVSARENRNTALLSILLLSVVFVRTIFFTGVPETMLAGLASRTLCLATDLPTEDKYVPTRPTEEAIHLAVIQNQNLGNGYSLKEIDYDDTSLDTLDEDAQIGAHDVQQMAQNSCIVGMIGPLLSTVAVEEIPIAADAGLAMVSPFTTLSGLTLRQYAQSDGWTYDQIHPEGKPLNFFRIAPNDVAQGFAAAEFTFDGLGARNVYVVNDREQFGEDLVGGFAQGFQTKGGRILGIESIPSTNLSVIADVAARIAVANPDAVYYAGLVDGGGPLKAQLIAHGYTGPFVGGEGIATDAGFVESAGVYAANGTLALNPASFITSISSDKAAQFYHAFAAAFPGERLYPWTAEAYDAAMVMITAVKQLIRARLPVTRAAVIEQVQHIQYAGLIGPISFDSNGDIARGVFSLYQVRDGVWAYVKDVRA